MAQVIESNDESDQNRQTSEDEAFADDDDSQGTANAGWADSVAKILKTNKPKGKKTLVLSKAKKLTDVKKTKTKSAGFQVAAADGVIKEEQIEQEEEEEEKTYLKKRRKKELPNFRVKPNILDKDKERTLEKIATRGVVQLFNAVRMQQKDIDKKLEEAGPLEVRKEKVLKSIDKRAFLDVLMGGQAQVSEDKTLETEKKKNVSTWSVLRDDFMMGAKMKDWDKEIEDEEEEQNVEMESE